MFAAFDTSPAQQPSTTAIAVVDEQWAAASARKAAASKPAAAPPPPLPVKVAMVDPRISGGVAAVLADEAKEAPVNDPAPNRQAGLQRVFYGSDAQAKFARDFSDAKKPACLSSATGGLGILAIPFIAVQALRGKCVP
jgi:hypothetical protein